MKYTITVLILFLMAGFALGNNGQVGMAVSVPLHVCVGGEISDLLVSVDGVNVNASTNLSFSYGEGPNPILPEDAYIVKVGYNINSNSR